MKLVQQEKPVGTKHETLGEFSFPVEVPQFESITEAATACGGEDKLLNFVNGQVSVNAKNVARAYARSFEVPEGTPESQFQSIRDGVAAKAQELSRSYTPSSESEAGPSKTKKAQAFDQLAALAAQQGGTLTREQIESLINIGK